MLDAIKLKLQGEIAMAKANIEIYLKNAAGIGEHGDIVQEVEAQLRKIADAEEIIEVIKKHY